MKNFKLKAIAIVLALLAIVFVGCNKKPPETTTPETTTPPPQENKPTFDAANAVSKFADKVDTTVKLTYVTNYKVDVVRPGADASGMASFKRDVVATTVIEMDLGADMYIRISKTRQDKLIEETATVMEAVLYKKGDSYFYQTSYSPAIELSADEAAEGFASLFEEATYEQIGGLTLDALLYNSLDKAYELKLFGLSDTFIEEDLVAPTYSAAANGGLKVNYKPEYIGYRTDGGWSDFSNSSMGYAADIEIITNDKGYVTSMKEVYNQASLVFNIMSNPPTVTITGERSFTASYGEAITKVESVEFAPSTAVFTEAVNGAYVVKTCAMGDFGNMADVADGGALEAGKILCIKPAAATGYEVAKVIVNGNETPMVDPAMAGGFYCFAITPGTNVIEVLFKALEPSNGVVNVTNNTDAAYELQSFLYGANGPSDYKVITDGIIEPGNSVFGAIVIDSSKEVIVTVNGAVTMVNIPAGPITFYCFAVKEGGEYDVVISEKDAAPEVGAKGIVKVTNNTEYEYQLQSFTYGATGPVDYKVIENGEIEPGASIFGAIVISTDTPVTVVVNGAATGINIPANGVTFYCFAVKEPGEFNVEINPAA